MTLKTKRPVSVWIAQIILGIYAFGISMIVLWGFYTPLTQGIPNPELYIVTTIGILAFVAVYLGGFWGMAIRKAWGRWLGVAGLVILLISTAVTQTSRFVANNDSSSVSLGFLFSILLVIGLAILVFMVALGDAADKFFDQKSATAQEPASVESDNRR